MAGILDYRFVASLSQELKVPVQKLNHLYWEAGDSMVAMGSTEIDGKKINELERWKNYSRKIKSNC